MLDLYRNNLDKSSSPYLRQHAKNPIWWQEWSSCMLTGQEDDCFTRFIDR